LKKQLAAHKETIQNYEMPSNDDNNCRSNPPNSSKREVGSAQKRRPPHVPDVQLQIQAMID
jgi:hypothetical protein